MPQGYRFGNYRSYAARPYQADDGNQQVDEKDGDIAYGMLIVAGSAILTSLRNPRDSAMNKNSHATRLSRRV
jgi:hypothetical protein